jgi:hypothetical protein
MKPDPFKYKPLSPLREDQNIENIISNIQGAKEAKLSKNNLFEKSLEKKEKMQSSKMNFKTLTPDSTDD